MREKLFDSKANKDKKMMMRQSGGLAQSIANTSSLNGAKYTRLQNDFDNHYKNDNQIGIPMDETVQQQQLIVNTQNDQLDKLSQSVGTLKSISRHIRTEVDEQAVLVLIKLVLLIRITFDILINLNNFNFRMLDELGNEIEMTDSKLDTTLKRVARVLHLSNGNY